MGVSEARALLQNCNLCQGTSAGTLTIPVLMYTMLYSQTMLPKSLWILAVIHNGRDEWSRHIIHSVYGTVQRRWKVGPVPIFPLVFQSRTAVTDCISLKAQLLSYKQKAHLELGLGPWCWRYVTTHAMSKWTGGGRWSWGEKKWKFNFTKSGLKKKKHCQLSTPPPPNLPFCGFAKRADQF